MDLLLSVLIFQFHKGAIRTNEALKVAFTGYNFNSIKVRLEHATQEGGELVAVFQFHKGAIRTYH